MSFQGLSQKLYKTKSYEINNYIYNGMVLHLLYPTCWNGYNSIRAGSTPFQLNKAIYEANIKARNIDILFTSPDTDNFIKLIYTMFGERNDNSPVKQIFIIDTRNSHGYKWCAKRWTVVKCCDLFMNRAYKNVDSCLSPFQASCQQDPSYQEMISGFAVIEGYCVGKRSTSNIQ